MIHVKFVSPKIKIMKKYLSLIAAGALIFGLTSCKKDWNCECKTTYSDGSTTTFTTLIPKQTKKDAETACNALETPIGSGTTDCTLK